MAPVRTGQSRHSYIACRKPHRIMPLPHHSVDPALPSYSYFTTTMAAPPPEHQCKARHTTTLNLRFCRTAVPSVAGAFLNSQADHCLPCCPQQTETVHKKNNVTTMELKEKEAKTQQQSTPNTHRRQSLKHQDLGNRRHCMEGHSKTS